MKFSLTIPLKGLILVGMLFTGEIVMLVVHLLLLDNAELQAQKERHARDVIYKLHESARFRVDAAATLFGYGLNRESALLHHFEECVTAHTGVADQLRQLMKDPKEAKEFQEFNDSNEQIFQILYSARQMIDQEHFGILEAAKVRRLLDNTVQKTRAQEDLIFRTYKRKQDQSSNSEIASRNMMRWLLISGICLNFLAALVLSRGFSRDIVGRLKVLMDNTNRLAQKQPLHKPLEGTDEISQLDSVFHEMAKALGDAERLKTDLLNMVSHDLRTPLTSIEGSLSYITTKERDTLSADVLDLVERAERNTRHMLRLVNDLLDIQKLSAGKLPLNLGEVKLPELAQRALAVTNPLAQQKNISIESDMKELHVWCDQERLLQVFINLISNAIKFSQNDTKISLSASSEGDYVYIRFTDQGRGIPQDQLASVFEPYHQVSSADSDNRKGSGLGLSICREIITACGGTLKVESELEKGTTFTICLKRSA